MFHFTYKLVLKEDPRYYYYGKHSTNTISDNYTGSGTTVKDLKREKGRDCFKLTILNFFSTSEEAFLEEEKLVGDLWKTDPFCLNRYPGGNWKGKLDVSGTVTVWMGDKERRIPAECLDLFQKEGWQRGRSPKSRIRNAEKKVSMTSDTNSRIFVPKSQVGLYLQKGFKVGGYRFSEEAKKNLSNSHRGLPSASLGRVRITKDGKIKNVKKEDVQLYLDQGWVVGSCNQNYLVSKDGHSSNFGKVCINDGERNFYCYPKELEKYLAEGWTKGRTKKSIDSQKEIQRLFREKGITRKEIREKRKQGIFVEI